MPVLGGTGNEVTVSPDTPTDPDTELWYDTDDVAPYWLPGGSVGQVPMKQSSADGDIQWAHVPRGLIGAVNGTAGVALATGGLGWITAAIPTTLLVGRRYKISWSFRAVGRTDASDTPYNANILLYNDVGNVNTGFVDHWHQFRGQWSTMSGFVIVSGDGVQRSYRIGMTPTTAVTIYPTWFIIEDVGAV